MTYTRDEQAAYMREYRLGKRRGPANQVVYDGFTQRLRTLFRQMCWAAWMEELKDLPCMDCGQAYPRVCMDFDHRPDSGKFFNISQMRGRPYDVVLAEVAKCDVVCSNCHRIRTQNRGTNG